MVQPQDEEEDNGRVQVSLTTTDDVAWLPIQLPGGKISAMAMATSQKDTLIDAEWCDDQGFPAGNVSPLKVGEINIALNALHPSDAAELLSNLTEQSRYDLFLLETIELKADTIVELNNTLQKEILNL